MQFFIKPVKIGWALFKWLFIVLVVVGISTAIVLLGLLAVNLLFAQFASDQLQGIVHAWSIILGVTVPLLAFIYVAHLAASRAHDDLMKASTNDLSSQKSSEKAQNDLGGWDE
jgi:hypothetical protein